MLKIGLKVLMVNGTYGGVSGSGRAVEHLSKELLKNGFEVYLCTSQIIGCVNIPKLKSLSFAFLAKLKSRSECDILHLHNPKFSIVAESGFPNVLTIHGDFLTEFSLTYGRLFSRFFDAWLGKQLHKFKVVTCVSPYWSKLRGWRYIPNGIDLDEIEKISPSRDSYVLFVGRKDKVKGYDLFEKAVKKLHYPYKMLGVYEKVPWRQVIAYMKSAYCLVLPSMQEGMPYVILEAWASGCPVIATDLPTLRSFGEGAIYFLKERSVKAIREAIMDVINNEDVAERLRSEGLRRVRDFDIKVVAKKFIEMYEEVYEETG